MLSSADLSLLLDFDRAHVFCRGADDTQHTLAPEPVLSGTTLLKLVFSCHNIFGLPSPKLVFSGVEEFAHICDAILGGGYLLGDGTQRSKSLHHVGLKANATMGR